MGRPPLPIGTAGQINTYKTPAGYRAACRYRDHDGVTRFVERHAKTKGRARSLLQLALKDRNRTDAAAEITADTLISDLAEFWWAEISDSDLAPNTLKQYRDRLDKQVLKAMSSLRIREAAKVSRIDRFIKAVKKNHGPNVAKMTRTVVSGMLGLAARHDAIDSNPTRDIAKLKLANTPARAFELKEAQDVRTKLHADKKAIAQDLPDFVDMMFATGERIGETAAITWDSLDLDAGTVEIRGTVIREKGKGLYIQPKPKSPSGYRTLELSSWAVEMLRLRKQNAKPNKWDVVFTAPQGGLRDPSNTNRHVSAAFDRAGYPWATSHSCRKTVATLMDDAGLSARAAADQLGHSRPSFTQDVYFARRVRPTGAARVLEAIANTTTADAR